MDDKEVFNPQSGERIAPKKPKKFWKDWRFYVYTIIAVMLAIVSVSSMVTACAAINAGVGQNENSSFSVANKRNAKETSASGLYDKYTFSVDLNWRDANSTGQAYVYNVDLRTYTLTRDNSIGQLLYNDFMTTRYPLKDVVDLAVASATPTNEGEVNFLVLTGKSTSGGQILYMSFVRATTPNLTPLPFIATNLTNFVQGNVSNSNWVANNPTRAKYILNTEVSDIYLVHSSGETPTTASFQDVQSYFADLGYNTGYTAGYAEGYDAGETHAYDTLQTGIAFETYGMYADAKITLVADRTEGSYYYMDLFDYVTDTYIERSVYVLYIRNASNSTWLGYVRDVNASDSSGATYDIGSFTGASSTTDVVFTALMDRNLWEGAYITSFHGHAEAVNNAFWFTGGSYEATQQIYQDGYGEGYDVGRSDGYGAGYDAGVQVGRAQGLNEAEPESLTNTLVAVFQQPFNQLYRFFNFNVLGLNVLGIVSGLISVLVVLKVFKKLYK